MCASLRRFMVCACRVACSRGCGFLFCGECVVRDMLRHYNINEPTLACQACRSPVVVSVLSPPLPTGGGQFLIQGLNFGPTPSALTVYVGGRPCGEWQPHAFRGQCSAVGLVHCRHSLPLAATRLVNAARHCPFKHCIVAFPSVCKVLPRAGDVECRPRVVGEGPRRYGHSL